MVRAFKDLYTADLRNENLFRRYFGGGQILRKFIEYGFFICSFSRFGIYFNGQISSIGFNVPINDKLSLFLSGRF